MHASQDLEKKSSAYTLSDMEIFIFPELLYSLVLANIMSPRIWKWRDDPWFAGLEEMKPYRRVARLKQFIMDHYVFNLDLDTWGLTTKEKEIARFRDFISEEALGKSNALFGYEGDKYYFDIDIRTHFGLNKYDGNIIPYWKTETVEAMDAFKYKPNYATGAGECVSLAVLYAAALFVVAKVPLKDIFLMATPLHSQNFIDLDDGVLTNNRRLVTKTMWFNGTELSAQARRALENEQVTVVSHETGHIHAVYDEATINPAAYEHFSDRLRKFLTTRMTAELLGNFLRHSRHVQSCFQLKWPFNGVDHYIEAERAFAYEDGSPYTVTGTTREKLMFEIERQEFRPDRIPDRILMNDLEDFITKNRLLLDCPGNCDKLREQFSQNCCLHAKKACEELMKFCHTDPRLPDPAKKKLSSEGALGIEAGMSREDIIRRLESARAGNVTADLAFYAYRDVNRTGSDSFIKSSIERSPVSIAGSSTMDLDSLVAKVSGMPNESIYDEPGRLAQPDEVWNFGRGDGVEKAVLLANMLKSRSPEARMSLEISEGKALLKASTGEYSFVTSKGLKPQVWRL